MGNPFSFLGKLFRRKQQGIARYWELRAQLFAMTPAKLGLAPEDVWGVVVETGYAAGSATLAALADGTANMYFSIGGGVSGAGQYEKPAAAAKKLVRLAADFTGQCTPAASFPLPRQGETRFYLFTPTGKLASAAPEDAVAEAGHPLNPLFAAAREVIAEIQEAQTAKKK